MLDLQFIGLNLNFAVNLLAALVAFAVFWLIFDAWTIRHEPKELFKWLGFLILSISFVLRAAAITSAAHSGLITQIVTIATDLLRLIGYAGIIIGQLMDPIQKRPVYTDPYATPPAPPPVADAAPPAPAPKLKKPATRKAHALLVGPIAGLFLPMAAAITGALYWYRATTGLERHLKPVAAGFAALTAFELLSDAATLRSSTNPNLIQVVQAYGLAWWLALGTLLLASFILGRWVWHYLTKRLQSQLFIILVSQTLALFLFSTVGFTFLLLRNVQTQSLDDLATASHMLQYSVTSRQAETAAQAEAVAASSAVATAALAGDHAALATTLNGYMAAHGLTTLTIIGGSGQVLLRGEDPERWGDARSSDPLVRRSMIGQAGSSVVVQDGVVAPAVTLMAASPIRAADGTIVGVALAGRAVSNAFVDGIRASTGLDSAVYGGNVRAATTLAGPSGTDRAVGVKEATPIVNDQVLDHHQTYRGLVTFQNRDYLAAFTPLQNINHETVGMLLVARPKDALYAAANTSIQLTFLFVVALAFLSIYPIYRVSRFLSAQLK